MTCDFGPPARSFFDAPHAGLNANGAVSSSGSQNLSLQCVIVPTELTVTRLDILAAMTINGSTSGSWSVSVGVYTRDASGVTINLWNSTSSGSQWSSGSGSTAAGTYGGISGTRWRSFAVASWSFTPGEYWFGFINSITGVGASVPGLTIYGQSSIPIGGTVGGNNDSIGMMGLFSAATGAFPTTIQISSGILYGTTGAATASNIARQPYFRMFGSY